MRLRSVLISTALLIAPILSGVAFGPVVRPVAQTASMPGNGDVGDDICVWINPKDGARSVIFGCNKSEGQSGGLYAFSLNGARWKVTNKWREGINWFAAGKKINNVDLCRGFVAGKEIWDIVAAANRSDRTLDLFRVCVNVDGDFLRLEGVGRIPIGAGFAGGSDAPYGLAVGSLDSRRCMVFASDKQGRVAQYELLHNKGANGTNQIIGRRFDNGGHPWRISEKNEEVEGIVVDSQREVVYFASEKEGIFRFRLKDGLLDSNSKIVVDRVGPRLQADVEGLALYSRRDGTGYLIASSQGSSTFFVYQREFILDQANVPITHFTIGVSKGIDGVQATDGIEAVCADFGKGFRNGVFIAHDGEGNRSYKIIPWSAIQSVLGRRGD